MFLLIAIRVRRVSAVLGLALAAGAARATVGKSACVVLVRSRVNVSAASKGAGGLADQVARGG